MNLFWPLAVIAISAVSAAVIVRQRQRLTALAQANETLRAEQAAQSSILASAQQQAVALALLDRVGTALSRETDLSVLFRTVVEAIAETFGYTLVSLYILEDDALVLQHQVGYDDVFARIPVSEGVMGRGLRPGQPVLLEDVRSDPAFMGAFEGIVSEICLPLFDGSRPVGVLNIESTNQVVLSRADLQLTTAVVGQLNIGIARARLYAEIQRRNRIMTALYDTALGLMNRLDLPDLLRAIIAHAAQFGDTEDGYVYLLTDDGQSMEMKVALGIHTQYLGTRLSRDEGLAGHVWRAGEPLTVDDYRDWPGRSAQFPLDMVHAAVGVPMTSGSQVIGVLGIAMVVPGRKFGKSEVELLTRLAQLASIALDNANLYAAVRHELADRKRAEAALAAANAELEQAVLNANELADAARAASRAKSEFIANISHEIRTPLNAVQGFAELLAATPLGDDQQQYLGQINTSSEVLLELINGLLDFSRIEAGRLELERVPFDIAAVLAPVTSMFAARAAGKGLGFSTSIDELIPTPLAGDPGRLRQVLINLVGNAVKFTERGTVSLSARVQEQSAHRVTLLFEVADTGIGIEPDKQKIIFEPFTQADGSITRRYGGAGLGLTISQRLVEKLGGQLWVNSQAGQGSAFSFTATFQLARLDAPSPLPDAPLDLRVLVAEDNLLNQRVIAGILKSRGCAVTLVENGREMVARARREKFDLIVVDVQMPELDGLSAIAEIRARERLSGGHVPVVVVTAYAMDRDRERSFAAGADCYVAKPFRAFQLYEAIDSALRAGVPQAANA
ncbi:MAG: GAF domain-containing protein [Chloroflexi bacterium]|nr:GAF domain-containing protein [Chloroflexota bacterium]